MKRLFAIPALLAVSAVAAIIITSLLMVIYPGSFRWTAPQLCPSGQTDAFVVRYSQATSDGQSTNFTLFCMDERGEITEVGSWRPMGLVFAGMTAALFALFVLLAFWRLLRRSGGGGVSPTLVTSAGTATIEDGSTPGIPDETRVKAEALIQANKMIAAIKEIREDTDLGLKEAKEVAEALRDGRHVPSTGSSPRS